MPSGRPRKPCWRCGGPKPPGERRKYCDACREIAKQEYAEKNNKRFKRWYAENREHHLARVRAYARATRPLRTAKEREWRQNNPERTKQIYRAHSLRYRAQLAEAFVENVEPSVLYERDEGRCGICGEPVGRDDFQVDHIVPISRGGEHSYANTQIAHRFCNQSKGAR